MWKYLNDVLYEFRTCFNRKASFQWFVVVIVSFMMGSDSTGITSVIRKLGLDRKHYESVLHFFHSDSWNIKDMQNIWGKVVKTQAPVKKMDGYCVLAGDGIKQPKEGKRIPGVKRHHQESENVSKSEYIFGHLFGVVGVIVEKSDKMFCLPLRASVQNGVNKIREWDGDEMAGLSHVEQELTMAGHCTDSMGKSIIVLDRLFLSVQALKICLKNVHTSGEWMLHMVTKAKRNVVAYTDPPAYSGKGAPRKKGKSIKLWELFEKKSDEFESIEVTIYNKTRVVRSMTCNLLWGQKLYQKLRFVLIDMDGKKTILVSTHLTLSAKRIIELYSWRFRIEVQFKELRHTLGGFAYRFWSKSMPKLNRFQPTKPDILDQIKETQEKETITKKLKAIEGYVMMACIALGLLQMMALKYGAKIKMTSLFFVRTKTSDIPTELTMSRYLDRSIISVIEKRRHTGIYEIIRGKQESDYTEEYQNTA